MKDLPLKNSKFALGGERGHASKPP